MPSTNCSCSSFPEAFAISLESRFIEKTIIILNVAQARFAQWSVFPPSCKTGIIRIMKIATAGGACLVQNEKAGSPKNAITSLASEISVPRVGMVIKRLRTGRGMSLQELSRLSGVSVGMLSQVERDRANPSLKVLTKIQTALGAKAGELFNETWTSPRDPGFVRRREARPFCDLGYLTKELLSAGTSHALEIMILHIPPHGSSGEQPLTSPTEKGGLVLEGTLVLKVGNAEASLDEGDSFVFDGQTPHGFRNPSALPVKVLWIINNIPVERRL